MKFTIGTRRFEISAGTYLDVKGVQFWYGEECYPTLVRITKKDGSVWAFEDDRRGVPKESGTMPVGVYDITKLEGV
jgi:hypothetical protein